MSQIHIPQKLEKWKNLYIVWLLLVNFIQKVFKIIIINLLNL